MGTGRVSWTLLLGTTGKALRVEKAWGQRSKRNDSSTGAQAGRQAQAQEASDPRGSTGTFGNGANLEYALGLSVQ